MGLLDRFRKQSLPESTTNITVKTHNLTGSNDFDDAEPRTKNKRSNQNYENLSPSLRSNLVMNIDYKKPSNRWLHTKANPYGAQHTYGVVDEMFWHQPYPFMYIKDSEEDVLTAPAYKEMDAVHKQWAEVDMFHLFKECLAQGNGIGTAWIVQIDTDKYMVFNPTDINNDEVYTNEKTMQIEAINFCLKGKGKAPGNNNKREDRVIKAKIGVNCIQFQPNPDNDDLFGRSSLLKLWMTMIYRARNHYSAAVYNTKGGVNSRVLMAPDNMGENSKAAFEREALKGVESELIEVMYPHTMVTNGIDTKNVIQWQEIHGNNPKYVEVDGMFATDSFLPPSFTQGPESGALGGSAPQEDAKRTNRFLQSYMGTVQGVIKDINTVFFDVSVEDYMAIPYFREEDIQTGMLDDPLDPKAKDAPTDKKAKEEQEPQESQSQNSKSTNTRTSIVKFTRQEVRNHSNGISTIRYKGNMIQSGVYEYRRYNWVTDKEEVYHEAIDAADIRESIEDPFAVKELYLDLEHMQFTDVFRTSAIGKLTILGVTEVNGVTMDQSELIFKDEWDPKHEEIFLSPIFACNVTDKGRKYHGKKIMSQTGISWINCSLTSYPRSSLTGLETKATKANL